MFGNSDLLQWRQEIAEYPTQPFHASPAIKLLPFPRTGCVPDAAAILPVTPLRRHPKPNPKPSPNRTGNCKSNAGFRNEAMARQYWTGQEAIGRRLKLSTESLDPHLTLYILYALAN